MDRLAWQASNLWSPKRVEHNLATKQQQTFFFNIMKSPGLSILYPEVEKLEVKSIMTTTPFQRGPGAALMCLLV